MRIAICDDELTIVNKIRNDVIAFFKQIQMEVELVSFFNGEDIIAAIRDEKLQINLLLLDVDMPNVSGLEVARQLRELDDEIIIIFVSAYEQYVFEALEYRPFRYIRKSRMELELTIALRAAYSLYQKRMKKHIIIKNNEGEYRVEQSKILYCEIVKRKLYIHLEGGKVLSAWKTMKELEQEIANDIFVKIHSGCIVNMKYIKEYSKQDITLDSSEKIVVSRSGMKLLKEKLSQYWSECV